MLSWDRLDRKLDPDFWLDLVTRLPALLLPEVRRLGENLRRKSSMVFTGDFSSNLTLTCKRSSQKTGEGITVSPHFA
jgi:hypothetical protein